MKRWIIGAWALGLSVASLGGVAHAHSGGPEITVQSVFHMPKPEAIGAAIGAVAAVQLAMRWRARTRKEPRAGDE